MSKMIGVLGGMGPAATADFYQKIIRATPAKSDQEHLQVLIFSNPQVPDRTAAIRGTGPDPLPILVAGAQLLIKGGADFITIPCVTAHHFYHSLQQAVSIPVLHLVGETVTAVVNEHPGLRVLGLLATTGTLESRLFESYFEPRGFTILTPDSAVQSSLIMEAIYAIKHGDPLDRPCRLIREAAEHLRGRGAQAIIAGCTEVPLVLQESDLPVPVIDPTWTLAQAAVRRALEDDRPLIATSQRCYKDRG
ncbi:MAG TPA: amino acid racemase [Candidatus Acidoferrum sp.]|nr:amino acid racemase [Candidatus Methylomirabilis sp.]HWU36782.1 amino acid racemase [Candidatus Acidoferrum sp.]